MCGDGRQPRILVDNFWIARSKTRTFSTPGFSQSRVTTFFRISTSLCQGQNNFISLTDIHVQHLASLCRICGDKIEDHKRKVDTNRFLFLKFAKSGEIYCCWILQKFIHSLKKNQREKANFNCKWCIWLLIEHALIIWGKIKYCSCTTGKQRKHQMREVNTKERQKTNEKN